MSENPDGLILTGLDGSNPLAFLAALGALHAADAVAPGAPRLSWRLHGVWRPVLHGAGADLAALADLLDADRERCRTEPALRFTCARGDKAIADVKAAPAELRAALLGWLTDARPDRRLTLDWFTAFVSEGARDNNGAAKPSALHFTAGQQKFLGAALELAHGATAADLRAALVGPWPYDAKLPVMGWDNTDTRDHALRASDPSKLKLGNPGADWLALRGLAALPTAARGGRQHTAGCTGGWKTGRFTWPLWQVPLTVAELRPTLTTPDLAELDRHARDRRGLGAVFQVQIRRSDQGGYGSVSPASAR